MADFGWANVIPAVAQVFGNALDRSDREDQQNQNINLQREFAQNGIRWRVEDAKAAGIHPLFALGGGGAAFAPNPVVVGDTGAAWGTAGQNVARALGAGMTSQERALHDGQLRLLAAQADKEQAMAFFYASEAARGSQSSAQSAPLPAVQAESNPFPGMVTPRAPDAISSKIGDDSTSAASNPFWEEHILGDGLRIDLPRSDEGPAEAAENPTLWPAILVRNLRKHGSRWISDVVTSPRSTDSRNQAIGDFVDYVRGKDRELTEALSGRHDYPAGRFYSPGPGWENHFQRFKRR